MMFWPANRFPFPEIVHWYYDHGVQDLVHRYTTVRVILHFLIEPEWGEREEEEEEEVEEEIDMQIIFTTTYWWLCYKKRKEKKRKEKKKHETKKRKLPLVLCNQQTMHVSKCPVTCHVHRRRVVFSWGCWLAGWLGVGCSVPNGNGM
ncbi:hypothetical protein Dimus_014802 [Dionaea muscipula]